MKLEYARGFENYRWTTAWDLTKLEERYVYRHRNLGILIYIREEKSWDWDKSIVECSLFNRGQYIIKKAKYRKEIEKNLEEIFKELVLKDGNIKVLFDGIFK